MVASVPVIDGADLAAIAAASGNGDVSARWVDGDRLYVRGVTQEALEAAAARPEFQTVAPPVPDRVTNFQARALMRRTILSDGGSLETAVREALASAKAAAAALPEADPARIAADEAWLAWEQSNEFLRHGALVQAIGKQMGFDDAALDQMFRDAAAIEA